MGQSVIIQLINGSLPHKPVKSAFKEQTKDIECLRDTHTDTILPETRQIREHVHIMSLFLRNMAVQFM